MNSRTTISLPQIRAALKGTQTSFSTARQFLKHPSQTGALAAAKPSVAAAMITAAEIAKRQSVVEFGPGTGVITEEITRRLNPGASFFGMELNEEFARLSRERCPGTTIYQANALELPRYLEMNQMQGCDAIISSLPWTLINSTTQTSLLDIVEQCLNENGVFVTYLYSFSLLHSNSRIFINKLKSRFGRHCSQQVLFPHMPPTHIYTCVNSSCANPAA